MKDDRIMTANGSIVGAVKVSSNAQDHPNFINDKLSMASHRQFLCYRLLECQQAVD